MIKALEFFRARRVTALDDRERDDGRNDHAARPEPDRRVRELRQRDLAEALEAFQQRIERGEAGDIRARARQHAEKSHHRVPPAFAACGDRGAGTKPEDSHARAEEQRAADGPAEQRFLDVQLRGISADEEIHADRANGHGGGHDLQDGEIAQQKLAENFFVFRDLTLL